MPAGVGFPLLPVTAMVTLNALHRRDARSQLLDKKGDYQGAESAARESIEVFNRAFTAPKNNVYLANPLMELGLILDKTGRSQKAETYLREALEIRTRPLAQRKSVDRDHRRSVGRMSNV